MLIGKILPLLLPVAAGLSGCVSPDDFKLVSGEYQGVLRGSSGYLAVTGVVSVDDSNHFTLQLADAQSRALAKFVATPSGDNGLHFAESGFASPVLEVSGEKDLAPQDTGGCFQSADESLSLCATGGHLQIQSASSSGFALFLDRKGDDPLAQALPPRAYTTDEIFDAAIQRSFSSQLELEQLVQARANSRNGWKNLIPHLSFSSASALGFLDTASLIGAVGDLAPFLLPSRWFQAMEAGDQFAAEKDALVAVRADAGSMALDLAFSIRRDTELVQRMSDRLAVARQFRDTIEESERLGLYPPGTSDDLSALANSEEQDLIALKSLLDQEHSALAQTIGLVNPQGVLSVDSGAALPDPSAEAIPDPSLFARIAVARSVEILQAEHLIDWANHNQGERSWNWLDPAGDPAGSLGFGLPDFIEVGSSQVRSMEIRKAQAAAQIAQRAADAAHLARSYADAQSVAKAGMEIQDRRVNRLLANLRLGMGTDMLGLMVALEDQLRTEIQFVSARYAYAGMIEKLNRLSFEGRFNRPELRP